MKILYNWLKQYLDFEQSPEELSELLTDCGLEVEGLEKWQPVKGGLKGFVIGEVKTCDRHPNADRLTVTTVDVGRGRLLPIVCGAPNVAAGQKVVVATVGSKLYKGDESIDIKKTKLRGELSEGMICAKDEIGLGTSHEGIMVLDPDVKTGMQAREYFNIEDDYIFEIGLTPNRTDAISHIGVARDIKAVLDNIDLIKDQKKKRELKTPTVESFSIDNNNLNIDVIVEDTDACPRYSGLTISGIEVKESPEWLQNRLSAIGLRPINNIVDIANYVLHETGQPLHAFDADEITSNKVIVKKLPKGLKFITLDEIEREFTGNDLIICNEVEGMCIGGVFGGIKSGVTEKTKNIFLESAYFDPVHIRKTSKHHDLQTDASFRFERGVDPNNTLYSLKRAAILIKEIAGGKISSEIKDVYPNPVEKISIDVLWKNIDRLIGKSIGKDVIINILLSLEFEILEKSTEGIKLSVPSYRVDVTREADVIEEILRIYGYNNIEIPSKQNSSISYTIKPDPENTRNVVLNYLSNNGFNEIMNNSLTKPEYYQESKDFEQNQSVNILNPLSRDISVMRQTLLFGGLETILYNLNRKNPDLKLYEFGKVYSIVKDGEKDVLKKYKEVNRLAMLITGRKEKESWYSGDKPVDYNYLKALSQNLLKRTGINLSEMKYAKTEKNYFFEGLEYFINNKPVFEIGKISKDTLKAFDIKQNIFYADLNLDFVMTLVAKTNVQFRSISKFPEVRRDLALLLDNNVSYADIEKLAYQAGSKLLKEVNLFDVYEGENIEQGKKSYAISFTLIDEEKTLTDKVIDKLMNKLMNVYQNKMGAIIR
jgi:phenylalanyl-tRNA synthetase beta chain